jgi:hypothetical protein
MWGSVKINYICSEVLRPDVKTELDDLISDAIRNGANLELPKSVDVQVGFTDSLNRTCVLTIHHPKRPILIKHKFLNS